MQRFHHKISFFLLTLSSWLLPTDSVLAQITNQIPLGVRPISMGEAFVAVADDGNAIYWNPAGLGRMERLQISLSYANLLGLDIKSYYLSFFSRLYFAPWVRDHISLGLDWSGIRTDDEELEYSRDQFNFSVALQPPKNLGFLHDFSFGANVKYLKFSGKQDNHLEADAEGVGLDLGLLYNVGALPLVPNGIDFGLMVHDVSNTRVKHAIGKRKRDPLQSQNTRWGFALRPFEDLRLKKFKLHLSDPVLAIDFDDRVHIGMEFWLWRALALRAGWQRDRDTDESAILSFGAGFKIDPKELSGADKAEEWSRLLIDLPLHDSRTLANTNQFSASIIAKDNPQLIRIEVAHGNEVYASLYPFYQKRESNLGEIILKNVGDEPMPVKIFFLSSKYSEKPLAIDTTIVIKPDTLVAHKITAIFTRTILAASEKSFSGEVRVAYDYKKSTYVVTRAVHFALFEKNYLTWDDPAKATAFVTSRDTSIAAFCNQVVRVQSSNNLLINSKISRAVTLFEALAEYGDFRYKPDPNLEAVLKEKTPDLVQYPSELLNSCQGDCDDFTVLYASLLENVGVSTALLSTSDHVFIMFDTGLPVNQFYRFKVDRRLLIEKKGTFWLPIETTWIDSSFARAWQEGADRYQLAQANGELEVFPVREGWAKYPPPPLALPLINRVASLKFPTLDARITQSLIAIQQLRDNFIDKNYNAILKREPNNLRTRNELGVLYAQNGELDKAQREFLEVCRRDTNYVPALNNLGNTFFIEADYRDAERYYQKALGKAPKAAGIHLNLAILYYFSKNVDIRDSTRLAEKSLEELRHARAILQENTDIKNDSLRATYRALDLLGLPAEYDSLTEAETKQGIREEWKKLWNSFVSSFHSVFKPRKPVPIRGVAAPRAAEPDPFRAAILWWSE